MTTPGKDDTISGIDLNKLSKIFETRLFRFAPSLDAYSDHSNLESRIRILAMQLGKQIERSQQDCATCLCSKARQQILESKLGKPKVEKIVEIVEKVKAIRRNGFHAFISREKRGNGRPSCLEVSCPLLQKKLSSSRRLIPLAMKNIYFNTKLVDAFSQTCYVKTHASLSARVDSIQWSALIEEAKNNIYHFEMWERSQEGRKNPLV